MQIYFLTSIQNLHNKISEALLIIKILESQGHSVIYEHVINRNPKERELFKKILPDDEYFKLMKNRIKNSDAVFCLLDGATMNVGFELSFALNMGIPTCVFYDKTMFLSPLIAGNNSDKLHRFLYSDHGDLQNHVVEASLLVAHGVDDSINLPLTESMGDYLNWLASKKKISKQAYIKNLIMADLLKNKMYSKYKGLKS